MWKILLDILLHLILTSPVIIIAIRWGSNSRKWTSFNHRQSLHLVPHGPSVKEEILEETYCSTEMKWILTQSIFQEYTSTSRFFMCSVCVCVCVCVRAHACACASSSFPPLSPDCFYFICKFRLISLLQQCTRGVGGRNNLITFSLPPPAPWRILLLLTDNNKPCFWDTEYHFLPRFGFLNLKKTH